MMTQTPKGKKKEIRESPFSLYPQSLNSKKNIIINNDDENLLLDYYYY